MPSRFIVREDRPYSTYHVYNRGVLRREIFADSRDYRRFLRLLRQRVEADPGLKLLAYSLMPNHFHLLLQQRDAGSVSRLMLGLSVAYTKFFNYRHGRAGRLFSTKYNSVRITSPHHLVDESLYIHRNPERAGLDWRQHAYSSRRFYLDAGLKDPLVDTGPVLECFDYSHEEYRKYLRIQH